MAAAKPPGPAPITITEEFSGCAGRVQNCQGASIVHSEIRLIRLDGLLS